MNISGNGWLVNAMCGSVQHDKDNIYIKDGKYEYGEGYFKKDYTSSVESVLKFIESRILNAKTTKDPIVAIPYWESNDPRGKDRAIVLVDPSTSHTRVTTDHDFSDQTEQLRWRHGLPTALFTKIISEVGNILRNAHLLARENLIIEDKVLVSVKGNETRSWTQKFDMDDDPRSYPPNDTAKIRKRIFGKVPVDFTKTESAYHAKFVPAYKFKLGIV